MGYLYVYGETDSSDSHLFFDNFFELGCSYSSDEESSQYTAWNSCGDEMVALRSGYFGYFDASVSLNKSTAALLCPVIVSGNWESRDSELRLPAVSDNYDGTDNGGDIPVLIGGRATGVTTVNTVKADDWKTLQAPKLGDNYILSAKDGDNPAQETFVLGNEDAQEKGYFLKRVDDADKSDDSCYMWQVAKGIAVTFDKNGGDTEANPHISLQEHTKGQVHHFDLPTTNPTRDGYDFVGWNTTADGTGKTFTATTDVTESITVYAQWEQTPVVISPMDLTVYVGGDGYSGVIGQDGEFASNDLPEIGFYFTLPDNVNKILGSTDENPANLSSTLRLTYNDDKGTTRSWSLELYGDESKSRIMENGHRVYIYKLLSSKVDDSDETVPARVQFTRADGSVMTDTEFKAQLTDQFRNYKISLFPGQLDEKVYKATITAKDGTTTALPIKLGTGTLKVRGNTDESYRTIEENVQPSVNEQDKGLMLASTAQANTQYYINNSGVTANKEGVRLLVDHSLDDALLSAYVDRTSNTDGKYSYQFRYLDLVDTKNGNAYVTMGDGQKMNLYWPVPSDAKTDSEFHIIHFKGIDRDSNADVNDLLTSNIPEELATEVVTIDGRRFIKFATDSFSPFGLLYEKGTSPGGGSGSGGFGGGSTVTPDPSPSPSPSPTPDPTPTPTPDPDPDPAPNPDQPQPDKPSVTPGGDNGNNTGGGTHNTKGDNGKNGPSGEQTARAGADDTDNSAKLPQTGQLWWPVWLLSTFGALLVALGLRTKRKPVGTPKKK